MRLKEEIEKAAREGYELIPPYKLAEMSRVADKIVQLIANKASPIAYGYSDMKVILRMVDNIISEGIRENE